jgi:hypothetical protein
VKQDIKSEEVKNYLKEFEEFCWGYSHKSPIYIKRSQYEKIKDSMPPGNYLITEDE